jgi:hypothetical protein
MRRKMQHGVDVVIGEDSRHQRIVANVADNQFARSDGLPEAFDQIVEYDHALAGFSQLPDRMTAYVAGTAGNQNPTVTQS